MRQLLVFILSSVSVFLFLLSLRLFLTKPKVLKLRHFISVYDGQRAEADVTSSSDDSELTNIAEVFYSSILGRSTYALVTKVHGENPSELNKAFRLKMLTGTTAVLLSVLMIVSQGSSALWTVFIALAAFWIPDLLLKNEYDKKQIALGKFLPDTIDLLNLCGEAGLGFEAAVSRVVNIRSNFITEELGRFLMEMQAGKTRSEALTSLINRNTNPEFVRFLSAVRQSERLGIPISKVLHEQATDLRARFRDLAKENAQKVTVKILAPVMLCFLPATFVVVLGPAILGLIEAFS